ncbi:MAG: phenylpyruvate tautomerase MIF-related protein [Gammaproteobacteria bacterium]|nr:phenylpyruvate tautomerase MIF-related protein [Gammaproteobacteria bacterium]
MPCLILKTNLSLSNEQQEKFAKSTSEKTASLLGKPESYVMILIEPQITMTMSGTTDPTAYIELKSINLPEDKTTELSNELCKHVSDLLGVVTNRIYIEFSNAQRHLWGWDNRTF